MLVRSYTRYLFFVVFGLFLYLNLLMSKNFELNYNLVGDTLFFTIDSISKLSVLVLSFFVLNLDNNKNTLPLFLSGILVLCSGNLHTVFLSLELLLLVQVILGNLESFKFHFLCNKALFIAILAKDQIPILLPISLIIMFFVWIGVAGKSLSGGRDLILGLMISVVLARFSSFYWPVKDVVLSTFIILALIALIYLLWKVYKANNKDKNLSYLIKSFYTVSLLGFLMGGTSDSLFFLFNSIISLSLISRLLAEKENINQNCFTIVGILLISSICAVPALGGHFPLTEFIWFLIGQFESKTIFTCLSIAMLVFIYFSFSKIIILFLEKRRRLKNETYIKEDYIIIFSCIFVVTFGYLGISEMFTSTHAKIIQKEMEVILGQKENLMVLSVGPQLRNIMAIITPFLFLAISFTGLQYFSKNISGDDTKSSRPRFTGMVNIKKIRNSYLLQLLDKLCINFFILVKNITFWVRDYLYRFFYRETSELILGIRPILIWVAAFFVIILSQAGLR